MVATHDLSHLSPFTFEHLVNALAMREIGRGLTGFGPGKDGGRDGYFNGEAPYPSTVERWSGEWYIQSKFLTTITDPHAWLLLQISDELKRFEASNSKRKWPDIWIVATNVVPSADPNTGAFARATALVAKARPGLKFDLWGGQKILDLLQEHPAIARRYGHLLTPGHVLSSLYDSLNDDRASVELIIQHLVTYWIEEQRSTKLDQAGWKEDRKPGIHSLFTDLPFVCQTPPLRGMLMDFLARASAESHRQRTRVAQRELIQWQQHPSRARLFFVKAGPGQGKSTVTQYLCQIQRAALILQEQELPATSKVLDLAAEIKDAAQAVGHWPVHPRIPIYIELKDYAKWLSERAEGGATVGVLTYVAHSIGKRVQQRVEVGLLRRALRQYRWLIVFDGLDEAPQDRRDTVAREVQQLIDEAEAHPEIDAFFVCTSRPQGYAGQFSELDGPTVDLAPLSPKQALRCARPLLSIDRSIKQIEDALRLLQEAIQTGAVREIMTSPLQAHIMAVLVRDGERPPDRRWKLYERFYRVMYQREANRSLADSRLRDLLHRHDKLLRAVHEALGFALHVRAETSAGAQTSLERKQFRALVSCIVHTHVETGADEIVETVMDATTERLVLVNTPDSGGQVRFDIRPLQEFFAAEYLYQDVDTESLRQRLKALAGDAHWHEVLHFLLSALFESNRNTEISIAMEVLRQIDQDTSTEDREFARRDSRGGRLAARLLQDGVLEQNWSQRRRISSSLEALTTSLISELALLDTDHHPQSAHFLADFLMHRFEEADFTASIGAAVTLGYMLSEEDPRLPRFLKRLTSAPLGYLGEVLLRIGKLMKESDSQRRKEESAANLDAESDSDSPSSVGFVVGPPEPKNWMVSMAVDVLRDPGWSSLSIATLRSAITILDASAPSQRETEDVMKYLGDYLDHFMHLIDRTSEGEHDWLETEHETMKLSFSKVTLHPVFLSKPNEVFAKLSRAFSNSTVQFTGLFSFIAAAVRFAGTLDRESLSVYLSLINESERRGTSLLAAALSNVLPVFPRSVSLSKMAETLKTLSDQEFNRQWQNHIIANIHGTGSWINYTLFSSAESITVSDMKQLMGLYPVCALKVWMSPLHDRFEFLLAFERNPNHPERKVAPPNYDPGVLDIIYSLALQYPESFADVPDLWGQLWKIFGTREMELRRAVCAVLSDAELDLYRSHSRMYPFRLNLPDEVRLLVPLCSSILADAWHRRRRTHRAQYEPGCSYAELVQQYVEDHQSLLRCAQDPSVTSAQREASVLLAALHPRGGAEVLSSHASLLLACFTTSGRAALPLAVGVLMDILGVEHLAQFQALLSNLIRASAERRDTRYAIDELLELWRARSRAPATQLDALRHWLAVPELSTTSLAAR